MTTLRLRLRPDVYLATTGAGHHILIHNGRAEALGQLSPAEVDVLRELAVRWMGEEELEADLLHRLRKGGWLVLDFAGLLTFRQVGPLLASGGGQRLSRFAVLRLDGDSFVLEAPLARAIVTVHDPSVLLSPPKDVWAELGEHGFLEEQEATLAQEQWGAHELWFHARSRGGFHDLPSGGTYWAKGRHDPLPARREPLEDPIPLAAEHTSTALDAVLDARRSIREHDADNPLTLHQLAAFLHRSARVMVDMDELSMRPTPSGGALHSLDIYPVVTNVAGLAPGVYRYDPYAHCLYPVPAKGSQLARQACAAAGVSSPPQVLLVISCRFGRVMWKYQSIGYSLVLKEVGALFQTMYLVATDMGLAPCALGAGNLDLFAQATGLNPLEEASVGEFMLGSRQQPSI